MRTAVVSFFVTVAMIVMESWRIPSETFEFKDKLSDYGFFQGKMSDLKPADGVVPYDLNTSLFSNYAEKLRFIKLPKGVKAIYNDSVVFDFPIGTVFIKNFYYPADFRNHEKGRKILETRLLVHEEKGWTAYPYIWDDEQTDADYDPAGETKSIQYISASGKKVKATYVIPNKNQCKGCHVRGQSMVPIGPAARHLNKDFLYPEGSKNQLSYWVETKMLDRYPSNTPRLPVWNDPSTGDVASRARAYLDVNCGNCHNRLGPASTSGLFLDVYEEEKNHLGVNKSPVAAGRGAGDLNFDITPGQPQNSILVFRMKTNDPAIAMPEIGREQVHQEGVSLIEEWIRKMPR
ncbi:MAG TPA: SO2930 family diheme c-type cytochrome [Cyclobacteriaceae bacterium]|nr:SO2930 family diheme c-type cytochrome [Cyclobacteriaceae bacterium]